MQNYIDSMLIRLGMDDESGARPVRVPISHAITDMTPLSKDEARWFMSACGMIGWLAGTGRIDLKFCHSRISAYMANPCVGALAAVKQAVRYCAQHKHLCLFQPFGASESWTHFSDSDHAGNTEPQAKRRSQLGYVSVVGHAPVAWGSKATSVRFDDPSKGSYPSHNSRNASARASANLTPVRPSHLEGTPRDPVCNPHLRELHPDMSSGAAEIYAASIALTEVMHLSYLIDEMGAKMDLPFVIRVDNTTAIAFSKGNVRRSKLKHIDARQQWVEWLRNKQLCRLEYVNTHDNLSDLHTKILDVDTFVRLRDRMMTVQPIPAA